MDSKRCSKCDATLPLSAFYRRSDHKSHHSACKACERGMAKDWYESNKDKAREMAREWRRQNAEKVKRYRANNREKHYRQEVARKYGVDASWFDEQVRQQGNACACCARSFQGGDKQTTPHVDHCHVTMVVRGILCNRCNTVLGLCGDDKGVLLSLAEYLKKCHG